MFGVCILKCKFNYFKLCLIFGIFYDFVTQMEANNFLFKKYKFLHSKKSFESNLKFFGSSV